MPAVGARQFGGQGRDVVSEVLVEAYLDALKSMRDGSPKPLVKRALLIAEDLDGDG